MYLGDVFITAVCLVYKVYILEPYVCSVYEVYLVDIWHHNVVLFKIFMTIK